MNSNLGRAHGSLKQAKKSQVLPRERGQYMEENEKQAKFLTRLIALELSYHICQPHQQVF